MSVFKDKTLLIKQEVIKFMQGYAGIVNKMI